jgi:hypothetical protein
MKRHHKLSSRLPKLMSLDRASGFNKVVAHTIFDVLENTVDKNKNTDSRIFSIDKISHKIVQRPKKIIPQRANIRLEPSHSAIMGTM